MIGGSRPCLVAPVALTARAEQARARAGVVLSGSWVRAARGARAADAILAGLPQAVPSWDTWAARTDSDVIVRFAGPRPEARLVVKVGWSPAGAQALIAQLAALTALRSHEALDGLAPVLPEVVASGTTAGRPWVVERALPGVDARRWTRSGDTARALEATARGVAALHAATAVPRIVDGALLDVLVDERLALLAGVRDGRALDALRGSLRASLEGRTLLVSRSHGDLWLGNVLLADDGSALTGLVDWEASRPADLPGVDLAHLVISTRALVQGASLGRVVRRLLAGDEPLTPLEARLLEGEGAPPARELVVLAWLQHVAQRLTQTSLHSPTRWLRRTVDPVLAGLAD
jgi:aminoglycoside phosphotransferase